MQSIQDFEKFLLQKQCVPSNFNRFPLKSKNRMGISGNFREKLGMPCLCPGIQVLDK